MTHYDVIVIGAGPAGSVAAWRLARAGARVALLERRSIPRHKTCGGGLPMSAGALLEIGPDLPAASFVEQSVQYMRHTFRFSEGHLAPINPDGVPEEHRTCLWMAQRSVMDAALAARAAAAGAELRDGLAAEPTQQDNGRVQVRAVGPAGIWSGTCDFVLGADGANGASAHAAGLREGRALAIAIEAEVPHRWGDGIPELRPDTIHLEYGAVDRGYAWIFPKADHLNVGAGVFRPQPVGGRGSAGLGAELRSVIARYLSEAGVPCDPALLTFHAHPLPVWNGLDRLHAWDGRLLLAGDAAGLINPIFGDGILHAMKSGAIAADCILSGETAGYTAAIGSHFRSNFDSALKLARFFYAWPAVCYRQGVRRPMATHTAARLLSGDALFADVTRRTIARLRRALAAGSRRPVAADA